MNPGYRLDAADQQLAASALRAGSVSFNAASLLLPRRVRLPAQALYAFCRDSDDVVDAAGKRGGRVARLRRRLDCVYAGLASELPADRALAAVVRACAIPKDIPLALLEGYSWDEQGRIYEDIGEVLDYSARVAGTVGVMMSLVMGCRDRDALARAADLGLAMQLTNIARDVGEDARAGRCYLPAEWLAREGISRDALFAAPAFTPALGRVVRDLLALAETYYERGLSGVAALPGDCRPAIRAAGLIYREIGRQVALNGYDSVSRRARTTASRKIALLGRALVTGFAAPPFSRAAPDASTAFLVVAASSGQPQGAPGAFERFLELLETAGRRHNGWHAEDRRKVQET
jgi:phytoene synthase